MLRVLVLLLAAGCATNSANGEPPKPPTPAEQPADIPPPPPPLSSQENATPASLYAECKDRVEQPQTEGECTKDEDCATGGCGQEVCTTAVAAAELMTTCEARLCFQVLDTCGCNDGVCSWSLKDEIPQGADLKPAPAP